MHDLGQAYIPTLLFLFFGLVYADWFRNLFELYGKKKPHLLGHLLQDIDT